MGRDGTGVTESRGKVRLNFTFEGRRCRETLSLDWTPVNIKAAGRMLAKIKKDIENGLFDYHATFPTSLSKAAPKFSAAAGAGGSTLGRALDDWFATQGRKAVSTHNQYRNAVELWKRLLGGPDRPLKEITPTTIEKVVGSTAWASPKSLNNYLIILRGAMKLASREHKDFDNPASEVENSKVQDGEPDPLSVDEMRAVLSDMKKNSHTIVHAYFVFAFNTGMRPEELIALRWTDIRADGKSIRVERAKCHGVTGPLKTYNARDVELTIAAKEALEIMRAYTLNKPTIFENPRTKRAWNSSKSQHEKHWLPSLARCNIERRRSYCTRHTFATVRLMNGLSPQYIARQLGHKNSKMVHETYTRWIDGGDSGRELDKIEAAMAAI